METKGYVEVLRESGLRVTPQRIAICDFLTHSDDHPTAQGIYSELKPHFPSLSLATVYNTLDVLVGVGFVNVLGSIGDDRVHFDANLSPHINLACLRCHEIVDIVSDRVNHVDAEITGRFGYKILGSRILYYGYCSECQALVE